MQVVILCGGQGTRIRDVADDVPKPMIPIGGQPILWHIMQLYARHGFRRFVLCLGYKGWAIKRYFLDYQLALSDFTVRLGAGTSVQLHRPGDVEDWEVTLAETGLATMTGGRVKAVEPYLDGDEFLLTYGDGVSDVDLTALVAFHRRHGRVGTVTAVHAPGRFGEMDVDGDVVTQFSEKPPVSPGWISGGFFVFRRDFLDRLPDDPELILEREPLHRLAAEGELAAYRHEGFWQCMDNSRDFQHLNQLHAEGRAAWLAGPPPAQSRRAA
jgi:glucose-1-phosphate cytidylyltransferase